MSRPLKVVSRGRKTVIAPAPMVSGRRLNERQKRQVKRLITGSEEIKYFPLYAGYATVNASGTLTKWTTIPQGDTIVTRDGSEINFKRIDLRFNIFATAAAAYATNAFRMIVFQWKPDDAQQPPTVGQVIDTGFTQPVFSPPNVLYKQNYRILYDKLFSVHNSGPGSAGRHVIITNKRAQDKIRFASGNTGTNMIYVLVISDAAVQVPSWSYGALVHFSDS